MQTLYREDQAFALRFDKKKMLTKNKSVVWVGIIVVLVTLVARLLFMHHSNSTQTNSTQSFPYGRDGKNIKHAGQMVDTMYLSITDRMTLVAEECDKLHIRGEKRRRLIYSTKDAGYAAIAQVRASSYTVPFQPHYPPLPQ